MKNFKEDEGSVRRKVLKRLKKDGWRVWPLSDKFVTGYPDLLCYRENEIMFLELKRPKGGVESKLQQYNIEDLTKCGFNAKFIRSVDEIYEN